MPAPPRPRKSAVVSVQVIPASARRSWRFLGKLVVNKPRRACPMKILVANLGSTSLKWRLFDFSDGHERMLHKGGFERVTDYAKAIEDCLAN